MMDIHKIWEAAFAVLLAVAGCIARLLNIKNNIKMKMGRILSEIFISAFAGFMVLLFAREIGLSGNWIGVVSGISGWIGPRILDMLTKAAAKIAGIDISESKDEAQEKTSGK